MESGIEKAAQIIANQCVHTAPAGPMPYCVLALMDSDGYPTASTLTAARADGIREVSFCTGLQSNKALRAGKCARASVCFNGPEHNITLVGDVEIVTDPQVKQAMWYEPLRRHYSGPEDPQYCVLRFRTRRYRVFADWRETEGTL